jgi:indole-3-glycerol phosphate synthase
MGVPGGVVNASFLEEVVARVGADAAGAAYEDGVPTRRPGNRPSFRKAIELQRDRGALLVEYKRASPGSKTPLPPPRSIDEFLRATDIPGVAGYSCLATSYGFDGSPARVAELAARTPRPVLFKEFVMVERQLEVAARTGAAAVLLIARLESEGLAPTPLRRLADRAHELGLEVLLELHDPAELSRADGVAADVYGVNVRDLASLAFEPRRAYATLDAASQLGLRPLLGLSGVKGPAEAREFWSRGCDGILVGSAVARSTDPARFLASLRRPAGGPT